MLGAPCYLQLNIKDGYSIHEYRGDTDTAFINGAKAANGFTCIYFIDCNGTGKNWNGKSPNRCDGVRWEAAAQNAATANQYDEPGQLSGYFKILRISDNVNYEKIKDVDLLPVQVSNDGAVTAVQNDEHFKHMRFAHAALKRYLASKPGVRPAQIWDYDKEKNNPLPADSESSGRHPYYVVDDFNGDGEIEYAVMLIDATKRDERTLAVFNLPPNDDGGRAIFTADKLHDYDTIGMSNDSKELFVGPIASDNGFVLKPSGKSYKLVDPFDEN